MPSDRPDPDLRALGPRVLITRPEPQASAFAARLEGAVTVISPILRIEPVAHDASLLAEAEGMVLTSVHAVPAAAPGRGRPAYCVGPTTAAAARAAGFQVITGPGDLAGLRPLIAESRLSLIHPRGRHVAGDSGVPGIVVYDQLAEPLNDAARALIEGVSPVILPLFSPRSARLLAEAVAGSRAPLRPVAISPAAAQAWRSVAGERDAIRVSTRSDGAAMLDAIRPLLSGNNPDRHGLNRM